MLYNALIADLFKFQHLMTFWILSMVKICLMRLV